MLPGERLTIYLAAFLCFTSREEEFPEYFPQNLAQAATPLFLF
ncbi:hypothetical protein FHS90_004493 [Rufibacter quisquiliarum]|uniref:Uncharacterized protein n=1 Tax=Rufibacter quisquiliarum TaxID=1549639 RepID=A0A839GP61_9BACT|nr:hypothetical protein [Rufibacter quisquiliarum]